MDLQDWRDLTFIIFAVLMLLVLIAIAVATLIVTFLLIKGVGLGRRKLNEVKPKITPVRVAAGRVEATVEKGSDAVASPFIKLNGLINAVRKGAETLVTGRDA